MPNFQYKAGLQHVGSYQVSGKPFVTGSINANKPSAVGATLVSFPSVTRWVVVSNNDAEPCRIGFSKDGVSAQVAGSNFYLSVPSGSMSPRLELKLTELWISGSTDVSVMAGLTFIDSLAINNSAISPGGTNWTGSTGV